MFWFFPSRRERLRRKAAAWVARLEGQPSTEDHSAFRSWYDAHPDHACAFDRSKAVYGATGLLAQTNLGQSRALPPAPKGERLSPYAFAAAIAALLLVSGAVLLGRPEGLMPRADAQMLLFATKTGEIRQIQLPDGSRMTLDAMSSARVSLGRELRQVALRAGRARFSPAPDDRRPFIVEAGQALVAGNAGSFDVDLIGRDAIVQAVEGSVSVERIGTGAAAAPVRLQPGQEVVLAAGADKFQTRPASRSSALWPSGRLDFVDTPLDQVVAEANRYSRGGISLGDPALARLRATGAFRAGDLEGLARGLAEAFMLRLERRGSSQFVLHPNRSERQVGRR